MTEDQITVAEAVRELRRQLIDAAKEGENQKVRFMPKTVEVELGITFTKEKEGGGGVKIWSILDLSGKAKSSDQSTHKVKLVLEPVGPDGKPVPISSKVLETE